MNLSKIIRKIFTDAVTLFANGMKVDVDPSVNPAILSDYYKHFEKTGDADMKVYLMVDYAGIIDGTLVLSNEVIIKLMK